MPERKRRPDLDEKFSLHPLEAEDVLKRLLKGSDEVPVDEDDPSEDEDD